jgi:hypothetical protein
VLLVSGCIRAPEGTRALTAQERNLVDVVMATWSAHGGLEPVHEPASHTCVEGARHIGINVVDTDEEMFTLTGYCGPTVDDGPTCQERMVDGACRNGCAWSVFRSYSDGVWPFAFIERDWPLFVTWDVPNLDAMIVHESLHMLEACSGRGIDYLHEDPILWGPDGLYRSLR